MMPGDPDQNTESSCKNLPEARQGAGKPRRQSWFIQMWLSKVKQRVLNIDSRQV